MIMLNQRSKARWRFNLIPSRFRAKAGIQAGLYESGGLAYRFKPVAPMSISHQRTVAPFNVVHALAQALELHQQGRLFEAEQHYSAILAADPDQADALHYLGLIRFANGKCAEALQSIAAAMRARAPTADVLLNH
ncbi:MAG TPA: hypothetical protein VFL53_02985, partial [Pseudolabrys sp.]|nr:hypothetical protein [Pseudolabrys sp.]